MGPHLLFTRPLNTQAGDHFGESIKPSLTGDTSGSRRARACPAEFPRDESCRANRPGDTSFQGVLLKNWSCPPPPPRPPNLTSIPPKLEIHHLGVELERPLCTVVKRAHPICREEGLQRPLQFRPLRRGSLFLPRNIIKSQL